MNKAEQEKRREEWRNRLTEWEGSGLTQAEYCNRNGFKVSQFLYWRKKYSEKKLPLSTFVQVPISPSNRIFPIRIEIGNRYSVEVCHGYDRAALEHIIGFLSRS